MSAKRALTGYGLSVACLLLSTSSVFAADILAFPIIVEPPAITGSDTAQDGQPIFTQSLRTAGAIVTKADLPVHYEGVRKTAIAGPPGPFDFIVPTGTVLVQAEWKGATVYCTSKTLRDAFWSYLDAGLCFVDSDRDGKLETLYSTDTWPNRIRSVSSILGLAKARSSEIALPYDPVETSVLPRFELRIVPDHYAGLLNHGANVTLQICSPQTIDLKSDSERPQARCSSLDWKIDGLFRAADEMRNPMLYDPAARRGEPGRIVWGPVTMSYTMQGSKMVQAKLESSLTPGPALLVDVGSAWFGADLQQSFPILHVEPLHIVKLPADPAKPAPGGDI